MSVHVFFVVEATTQIELVPLDGFLIARSICIHQFLVFLDEDLSLSHPPFVITFATFLLNIFFPVLTQHSLN